MNLNIKELHKNGYLFLKTTEFAKKENFIRIPINLFENGRSIDTEIKVDNYANFCIQNGNSIRYAIINGFIVDLLNKENTILNGLIFS